MFRIILVGINFIWLVLRIGGRLCLSAIFVGLSLWENRVVSVYIRFKEFKWIGKGLREMGFENFPFFFGYFGIVDMFIIIL